MADYRKLLFTHTDFASTAQFSKQTALWLQMVESFNQSLKVMGKFYLLLIRFNLSSHIVVCS